jgi:molybdopterin-guanine dinucleotide biosynthesis protein A
MGVDKSFVDFDGQPMIQHVLNRVRPLNAPVLLVTNMPDRYLRFKVAMSADLLPGKGSLGGVYSALAISQTDYTVCVACDMPLLNADLLAYLLSLRDGYDAVVPVIDGQAQGLHAVYHRRCAHPIRAMLDSGNLRVSDLFERVRTRRIDEAELRAIDPSLQSFVNINTPDELAQARRKPD